MAKVSKTQIESKNDYLITIKGNQVKLYTRLKDLDIVETFLSFHEEKDVNHRRIINREISVDE